MKIEKKLIALSILALVLGIITVVPIALMPSVAESQSVAEPYIMLPEDFHAIYGTNATNAPKYVVVCPTETCYYFGEDGSTLPIEELYLVYGGNVTASIKWFFWPAEPGEFLPVPEPGE